MWSLEGVEPPQFLPKHARQFLHGAACTLPQPEVEAALTKIIDLTLKEGELTLSVSDIEVDLRRLRKAQAAGSSFTASQLAYHMHMPENNNDIIFLHLAFEDKDAVDKITVMKAVLPRLEQSNFTANSLNSFEAAWRLVDPTASNTLNIDKLFLLLYLLGQSKKEVALPKELPPFARSLIFEWQKEDMEVLQQSKQVQQTNQDVNEQFTQSIHPTAQATRTESPRTGIRSAMEQPEVTAARQPEVRPQMVQPGQVPQSSQTSAIPMTLVSQTGLKSPHPLFTGPNAPTTPHGNMSLSSNNPFTPERMAAWEQLQARFLKVPRTSVVEDTAPPRLPEDIDMNEQSPVRTQVAASGMSTEPMATPNRARNIPAHEGKANNPQQASVLTEASSLPLDALSLIQTTTDSIVAKASDIIVGQVKDLLEKYTADGVARGKTPPGHRHAKSDAEKKIDAAIRELTRELMGWGTKSHPHAAPPNGPNAEELKMHDLGLSKGPTKDNFRLDWNGPNATGWNRTASYVFADEFIMRCKEGYYAVRSFPDWALGRHDVANRFRSKLPHLKTERKHAFTMALGTEEEKIAAEMKRDKAMKAKRHRSRCDELFKFRLRVLDRHPEAPPILRIILEYLGVDGMSSDDTDVESTKSTKPKFYRIHQVWRAEMGDKAMFIIDELHGLPNPLGQLPRHGGNVKRERIGNHPVLINEEPVPDLPKTFYNKKFLAKHPGTSEIFSTSDAWKEKIVLPDSFEGKIGEIPARFQPHIYPRWQEYA
ncbi:hypothetical protein M422DRAFT_262504 [Sphaerobolus stellatus SS14]|uniref:Uncharacterized protein n=1 Tax=Sphaerobolus stellatus (strain SS14) TaxID=990650 RepID=A0A0C9VD54_SPHS4|nr:hypothetical protein M422DRAFT_262504 [Sphaerobolus stellatus SS14]